MTELPAGDWIEYANASFSFSYYLDGPAAIRGCISWCIGTRYKSSSARWHYRKNRRSTKNQNCPATRFSKTWLNLRTSACWAKIISTI